MKKQPLLAALLLVASALLLHNCHKELFEWDRLSQDMQLEHTLLGPLVYGEVDMDDIMERLDLADYVGTFPDSLVYVAFIDTLASVSADTVFALLDTIDSDVFYLESDDDVILPGIPGDTSVPIIRTESLEFDMNGDHRLYEVLIRQGITGILVSSTFRHEGILTIRSDQFLDPSGESFRITIPIDDASGNFETWEELDNTGYTLKPAYEEGINKVEFIFELQIINSGQPILTGERCAIEFSLINVEFEHIYGFIDSEDLLDESGSIDIPLWEGNPELKAVTLGDPRIDIILATSVGIPLEMDLDSFIAVGPEGEEVPLVLSDGNTLFFPAPSFDEQGSTVVSKQEIDNTNSNIVDFLAATPSHILYSVDGRTALMGEDTMHFVLGDSKVELSAEVVVPLDFLSTGYALSETLEFEIEEEVVDTSIIRNVEVSITTVNDLPVELMMQVYLLDENQLLIDSIFDDSRPVLAASVVDSEGKFVEASEETNTVEMPVEKLGRLGEVRYLEFQTVMTTSGEGSQFVKIYSYYTLEYAISVMAETRINPKELL